MALERSQLLADESTTGAAWCRAHTQVVDQWLQGLFEHAAGRTAGLALVAIGGYGRSELCPGSDIDVMLVHDRTADVAAVADKLWYPIWDEGIHLGHSVTTVAEALALAGDDLDTATALLSARHLAGDADITERLATSARGQWDRRAKRWLTEVGERVTLRHERIGEVAFALEPDLKEGRGGMRDVHALQWVEATRKILGDADRAPLDEAYRVLLDARVELHRRTGRTSNVMVVEDQDVVAAALGYAGADDLMSHLAAAARAITWTSDDAWRRIRLDLRGPLGRLSRRRQSVDADLSAVDGEIRLLPEASPSTDPVLVLRAAAAAAGRGLTMSRPALDALAAESAPIGEPWPLEARQAFVALLRSGRAAIPVIEALDHTGIWERLLPEWAPVRAKPQRNAYHRFTIDRHLLEAVAQAARLTGEVERPDLLVVAALLHDLGKGRGGDHTEIGVGLARGVMSRLGFPSDDVARVTALVSDHLLLPDVATRRDLDDPQTIARVASAVGSVEQLHLLAALTEADSRATGSSAWGPWKADLVRSLVGRVEAVLGGVTVTADFPSADQLALLRRAGQHIEAADDTLTVMTDDRPGIFSRVAGVLALRGLDVLGAAAHSTDNGRALAVFSVVDRASGAPRWDAVTADLALALDGRLALDARLAARARTYARRRHRPPAATRVTFHNDLSADATVIDVHAADGIGVLYRITRALAELDLDIRSAKVQTLDAEVVDAFYVRDRKGRKITDAHLLGEIERAIVHSLAP